jgi:hypothetical protein
VSEIKYFLNHQKCKDQETAQTEYTFFLKHLKNGRLDYAYLLTDSAPWCSLVSESTDSGS